MYILDQQRGVKTEDQDLQLMKELLNGPLNHFDQMKRSTNGFSNGHTERSHTCVSQRFLQCTMTLY